MQRPAAPPQRTSQRPSRAGRWRAEAALVADPTSECGSPSDAQSRLADDDRLACGHRDVVALLPSMPASPWSGIPSLEAAGWCVPADGHAVGGDFLVAAGSGADRVLVLGDVCGKGAAAAGVAHEAVETVRAAAARTTDLGAILEALNLGLVAPEFPERFCTAVCLRLRLGQGTASLTVAVGGHPAPLLLRAEGGRSPA